MTDEDAFQAAMDAEPQNWFLKQVFADWLEDGGDTRSIGYRALGVLKRDSTQKGINIGGNQCPFWFRRSDWADRDSNDLPYDWYDLIELDGKDGSCAPYWKRRCDYARRELDDAAAIAFSKFPPERQAELLQMELVA